MNATKTLKTRTTAMEDLYAEGAVDLYDDTAYEEPQPARPVASRADTPTTPSSTDGITARHVGAYREKIVAKMRLNYQYGDDAIGGELLGFRELDEELNIEAGRLTVMAAREGVGKTACALQMARNVSTRINAETGRGGVSLYLITEMSAEQTVERVIAGFAQVEARKMRRGVTEDIITATERAFTLLETSGLHIANVAGRNINEIVAFVRQFKTEHQDLRIVFVDNLTGIAPYKVSRQQGLHEYVGEIVEALNRLSMPDVGVNAPIFLLAHLARPERGKEGRRPASTDLAGSDRINRFADTIILLHKLDEASTNPDAHEPFDPFAPASSTFNRTHEVLVTKNRDGRQFICDLEFVGPQLRFIDPKSPTVRPYEVPKPESEARSEYRKRILELETL